MTAQREDILQYNLKKYKIVALSDLIPFRPQDYGMKPHILDTACYRGYWCEYGIQNDSFILKTLFMYNEIGSYLDLNNKSALPNEYEYIKFESEKMGGHSHNHDGYTWYTDFILPVPFTGKMMIGKDFLKEYYVHLGFQQTYAYKTLIELAFLEGRLIEVTNLSNAAETFRLAIKNGIAHPHGINDDFVSYIDDCCSIGYEQKTWWLSEIEIIDAKLKKIKWISERTFCGNEQ